MEVPEVQHLSEDASLETGNNEDGGLLNCMDVLDNALTELSSLCEETAVAIADFKRKMIANKDNSYKVVVQDYLSNSSNLLEFCTEVENFLDSARRSHSYIEHGVGREEANTTSDILKNSIASVDELVERARCLREMLKEMSSKFNEQQKLMKDHSSTPSSRKLIKLDLNILRGPIVDFLKKGATLARNVRRYVRGKADDQLNSSLPEATQNEPSTNRMGDIKIPNGKVVNSIESLAPSENIANGGNVEIGIKNIKFLDIIEVLEKKTGECSSKILKARQDVLK